MRIAIVGTGRMGSGLGRSLASARHDVRVGSRDAARGERRAAELGAGFGGTYREAAAGAEVVILAVPWWALREALSLLGDLTGAILVDVTNPLGRGRRFEPLELPGSSGAEELQALVPEGRVVKAWNHVYSGILRRSPEFDGIRATVFVAGDDATAKAVVAGLARDIGYAPADAGPLSSARYLEPLAALMTTLDRIAGGRSEHALRLLARPAVTAAAPAEPEPTVAARP